MSENDMSTDQLAEIGNLWARHAFNLERRISLEEEGSVEKLAVIKSVPRLIDEIRRQRAELSEAQGQIEWLDKSNNLLRQQLSDIEGIGYGHPDDVMVEVQCTKCPATGLRLERFLESQFWMNCTVCGAPTIRSLENPQP